MKNTRKVLLGVLLSLLVLSGCSFNLSNNSDVNHNSEEFSETNGLSLPITNENIKISVLTEGNVAKLQDKVFAKTIKKVTGVDLDLTTVPSANLKQRIQMLVASKNLPDIFNNNFGRNDMESLVRNDVLVAFDEHLDIMPNYKSLFIDNEEAKEAMLSYTLSNGHIYTAPGYNITRQINHGFLYRKDIFDKNNIKPWTNTEEFYAVLKRLKEIYPNSYPFVSKKQLSLVTEISKGWGLNGLDFYFDKESNTYKYGPTEEKFKEVLDFFKKLYKEGLIDPEFLTCTQASWDAKMTKGETAFVTYDWIDRMDMFYEQVKTTNPEYDLRFGYPIGSEGKYVKLSKIGGATLSVRNNEKKEVSIKLVDFLLSPAGSQLSTLGVLGQTYTINDNGMAHYLGFDDKSFVNASSLEEKYGLFTSGLALRFDDRSIYYQYTDKNQEAQDMVTKNNLLTEKPIYNIQVLQSDSDQYNEIFGLIQKEAEQLVYEYLLGDKDTSTLWSLWLSKAEQLGSKEMTDIYNRSYMSQINR